MGLKIERRQELPVGADPGSSSLNVAQLRADVDGPSPGAAYRPGNRPCGPALTRRAPAAPPLPGHRFTRMIIPIAWGRHWELAG